MLFAESHTQDIRYVEATVVSTGSECDGISKDDVIYYDRHAGHKIELDRETYHVIKNSDVVFVL